MKTPEILARLKELGYDEASPVSLIATTKNGNKFVIKSIDLDPETESVFCLAGYVSDYGWISNYNIASIELAEPKPEEKNSGDDLRHAIFSTFGEGRVSPPSEIVSELDNAIALLKAHGYKVLKPTTQWEEV